MSEEYMDEVDEMYEEERLKMKGAEATLTPEQKHRFTQYEAAVMQVYNDFGATMDKYPRGTEPTLEELNKLKNTTKQLKSLFVKPEEADIVSRMSEFWERPHPLGEGFGSEFVDRPENAAKFTPQTPAKPLPPTTPREQTELRRIFAADAPSRLGPPKRVVASPMAVAKIGGPYSLKAQPEMRREAAAKLAKITAVDLPDEGGQKAR